jgi:hypothetical protein
MDRLMQFLFPKKKRLSPQEKSRAVFERRAREQFLRLKRIGLGISIMSL